MNPLFSQHSTAARMLHVGRSMGRVLAMTCLMGLASALRAAEEPAAAAGIPFAEIGAKTTKAYQGDTIGVTATKDGAQLRTGFQKLAGTVTRDGLWLDSTEVAGGCLQVISRRIENSDALTGAHS